MEIKASTATTYLLPETTLFAIAGSTATQIFQGLVRCRGDKVVVDEGRIIIYVVVEDADY